MTAWLRAALDHIPDWLEHQMRVSELPGCSLAIAHQGRVVLERAFGHADLVAAAALTPQHRFRVASHSKSFTATGIFKLREQGRLSLDDRIGRYVPDLHRDVASATLTQLLSHSAGLVRDGSDAGQWTDRQPFLDEAGIRVDLAAGLTIAANTRFKYSNHGFGLLGLAIAGITSEPYVDWIAREVVAAAGLKQTTPDVAVGATAGAAAAAASNAGLPLARGHSAKWPLGRRLVIPGDNPTRALASATGFISTAGDLARFFAQLSPSSKRSVLTVASRREMTRRQWREPHASLERWYGLGTMSGTLGATAGGAGGGWDWFGHTGGFQGTLTRTAVVPAHGLSVSVLTNSADGLAQAWVDGCLHILRAFERHGAPSRRTAAWGGRWWTLWGAIDLLPMGGDKVLVANPSLANPLLDATELAISPRTRAGVEHGHIALAGGYGSHGEPVRLLRDANGRVVELWLAGTRYQPQAKVARELVRKYG